MPGSSQKEKGPTGPLIWAARILALAWAGWWLFFAVASGYAEGGSPMDMLIHAILMPPAVPFLVISLLAWRWERTGGALLIVAGLTMGVVHRMMTHGRWPLVSILLGLPALLAGLLFLIGRKKRKAGDACVHPA